MERVCKCNSLVSKSDVYANMQRRLFSTEAHSYTKKTDSKIQIKLTEAIFHFLLHQVSQLTRIKLNMINIIHQQTHAYIPSYCCQSVNNGGQRHCMSGRLLMMDDGDDDEGMSVMQCWWPLHSQWTQQSVEQQTHSSIMIHCSLASSVFCLYTRVSSVEDPEFLQLPSRSLQSQSINLTKEIESFTIICQAITPMPVIQ